MRATTNTPWTIALCLGLLCAPPSLAVADTVVVQPGDTIAEIAARELGDKKRFPEICALNQAVLDYGCDYISVGMVLTLPARQGAIESPAKKVMPDLGSTEGPRKGKKTQLNGDFVAQFSRSGSHVLNASNGYKAEPADDFVRISGHLPNAPSDGIPGIWFKVPSAIEQQASGRTILVKVLVRAPTPGPVALTYSRNEIGASGWITKGAGTRFRTLTFSYRVPLANNFGGDYVGILPDPRNARQHIEVAEIALSVLGEPHSSQTGVTARKSSSKEWTFDAGAEGFTVSNGTLTWQADGNIKVAATAADVVIRSPAGQAISGAENTVVSARIRVTNFWGDRPGWDGACFYVTSGHNESASFFLRANEPSLVLNEWRVLRWDMANLTEGGDDWVSSIVSQIRIDLQQSVTAPFGTIEIDWVRVGSQ